MAAQRLKAIERAVVDGNWSKAQFLELIGPEGTTLLDKAEEVFLNREAELDQRLRPTGSSGSGHPAREPVESRSEQWPVAAAGKGGKGKAKAGRASGTSDRV